LHPFADFKRYLDREEQRAKERSAMRIRQLMFAGAAVVVLAGCADTGVGYYGGGYYGPVADVGYDGYYDGFYGPVYEGYWNNNVFFYRNSDNDRWRRGDSRHFRREAAPGFNRIQGTAHARPHPDRRPN
jgi:hypothetical protein